MTNAESKIICFITVHFYVNIVQQSQLLSNVGMLLKKWSEKERRKGLEVPGYFIRVSNTDKVISTNGNVTFLTCDFSQRRY